MGEDLSFFVSISHGRLRLVWKDLEERTMKLLLCYSQAVFLFYFCKLINYNHHRHCRRLFYITRSKLLARRKEIGEHSIGEGHLLS